VECVIIHVHTSESHLCIGWHHKLTIERDVNMTNSRHNITGILKLIHHMFNHRSIVCSVFNILNSQNHGTHMETCENIEKAIYNIDALYIKQEILIH